ncbi:MAG: hypothetical protein WB511_01875 [Nitrososphaeraceae archaeon]
MWICKTKSTRYQSCSLDGRKKERGHIVYFIGPFELNLPLLDKMHEKIIDPSENLKQLKNQIVEADG